MKNKEQKEFDEVDGTVVDTTKITDAVWCAECGFECEEEAVMQRD